MSSNDNMTEHWRCCACRGMCRAGRVGLPPVEPDGAQAKCPACGGMMLGMPAMPAPPWSAWTFLPHARISDDCTQALFVLPSGESMLVGGTQALSAISHAWGLARAYARSRELCGGPWRSLCRAMESHLPDGVTCQFSAATLRLEVRMSAASPFDKYDIAARVQRMCGELLDSLELSFDVLTPAPTLSAHDRLALEGAVDLPASLAGMLRDLRPDGRHVAVRWPAEGSRDFRVHLYGRPSTDADRRWLADQSTTLLGKTPWRLSLIEDEEQGKQDGQGC